MDKPTFEQQSMFQYQGNHVLKGATFEGKNMLPIGSIFFPLRVAPVRIEYSMRVKLLTEHHLEFLSIKRRLHRLVLSLHLSKCHIVGKNIFFPF